MLLPISSRLNVLTVNHKDSGFFTPQLDRLFLVSHSSHDTSLLTRCTDAGTASLEGTRDGGAPLRTSPAADVSPRFGALEQTF